MPPGRLPLKVLLKTPVKTLVKTQDLLEGLRVLSVLGTPQVWVSLLDLLPPRPDYGEAIKDGDAV